MSSEKVGFRDEVFMEVVEKECKEEKRNDEEAQTKKQSTENR